MNTIMKDLEKKFIAANGEITIGDSHETTTFKLLDGDGVEMENILISIYNLIKVSQVRINRLENNLDSLAFRVYNTTEDFTDEELIEIKDSLQSLEDEDLQDIDNCKSILYNVLYCTIEDFDLQYKKQKELMNKIYYPTRAMYDTFNKLVDKEIHRRKLNDIIKR